MGKDDFIKIIKEEDSKDFMIDKIRDKDKFVKVIPQQDGLIESVNEDDTKDAYIKMINEKVELQPDQIEKINNKLRPFPITVEVDLTNHCNHRCSFCVWGEHISTDKSTLKKENILKCIEGMRKLGSKAITFTGGGEPMIHKDFYLPMGFVRKFCELSFSWSHLVVIH